MARTFDQPRAYVFLARLQAVMGQKEWTADELAAAMFTHRNNLVFYLNHLRSQEPRQAYIANYRKPRTGGRYAFLYKLGDMPDARHPRAPITDSPCI